MDFSSLIMPRTTNVSAQASLRYRL
ncbi:hypothetical protein CCACVL1_12232 [Corchorus capsularis]|uniref:Uncharacterized protein n=1 Tax=Corchorus capsularis TaxID=210143 RepID=A0A1R3IGR5_COCAP|nr:hypothetical protein CCACVL1_12232 [Corchorus capsularis]